MNASRSDRKLPALVRLYRLALWLYPTSFVNEYVEEMQDVFRLRLEDAARRGRGALLGLVFKEVITLPAGAMEAHSQARKSPNFIAFIVDMFNFLVERGSKMSIRQHFPKSAEQTPWLIAILSLVPFILPGPLSPLLTYHPWWDPNELPLIAAARVPLTVGLLVLGFLIGILKGFPRWSYLYNLYIITLLPMGIIYLINRTVININRDFEGYIFMLVVLILVALTFFARRYLLFLRPFFTNIRADWTLLSYALYACTFFITSTNDMEESPVYNLQVILPSLIIWLGALAYLRLPDPMKKVGALLGSMLLAMLTWWWPVFGGNSGSLQGLLYVSGFLLLFWVFFGGLILAPLLIDVVLRRSSETMG